MYYQIISMNDKERDARKKGIHSSVNYQDVSTIAVNGSDPRQLAEARESYPVDVRMDTWSLGEAGVWFSFIDAWAHMVDRDDATMVFEDDAMLCDNFQSIVDQVRKQIPLYDFISWYVPLEFSQPRRRFPRLTYPNQRHGMVCIEFSPKGADRILHLVDSQGITKVVDHWLFDNRTAGNLLGFSLDSWSDRLVEVDFSLPSRLRGAEQVKP